MTVSWSSFNRRQLVLGFLQFRDHSIQVIEFANTQTQDTTTAQLQRPF